MVCVGVGEEFAGASPITRDLADDEHPLVKRPRAAVSVGVSPELT